jgi:hypothetical protein
VFAHISDDDVEDWQSSIDIVLRRFAEYHDLEGAFGRRAFLGPAKRAPELDDAGPPSRKLFLLLDRPCRARSCAVHFA